MKEILEGSPILICVLELADKSRIGGIVGTHFSEIKRDLASRGLDENKSLWAIKYLRKNDLVQANGPLDNNNTLISITDKGRDILYSQSATSQFNIRAPISLQNELKSLAAVGESVSSIAIKAMEEWVRTNKFPGIDFRWTPTGRKPHVTGTGLSVWELYHIWKDHSENTQKMLEHYPHLTANHIHAAVSYANAYINEMPVGEFGAKPQFTKEVKI